MTVNDRRNTNSSNNIDEHTDLMPTVASLALNVKTSPTSPNLLRYNHQEAKQLLHSSN